jgi:hypothetical protein
MALTGASRPLIDQELEPEPGNYIETLGSKSSTLAPQEMDFTASAIAQGNPIKSAASTAGLKKQGKSLIRALS